jgi:site-specific recombinase XerD
MGEKEAAIAEFEEHASAFDIGEITREKIIAFRDYLFAKGLKTPTVNKKVGQITTLLTTAQRAGWIETAISGGIYIDIPAGTNEREPFDKDELDLIFSQPAFTLNQRSENLKAGGELEFWIPVISATTGLISSEIICLGPDTVGPHPDHPAIICFSVTNAGGRSLKAFSRKRYVPVRQELIDHGFMDFVARARDKGWSNLWTAANANQHTTQISNYFSAFWSGFLRNQIGITDPLKSLYSLRHGFRDALSAAGATAYEKDQLMGHAEAGTGRKYGAKKEPRVVDIQRLNELVHAPAWLYLEKLQWPSA